MKFRVEVVEGAGIQFLHLTTLSTGKRKFKGEGKMTHAPTLDEISDLINTLSDQNERLSDYANDEARRALEVRLHNVALAQSVSLLREENLNKTTDMRWFVSTVRKTMAAAIETQVFTADDAQRILNLCDEISLRI